MFEWRFNCPECHSSHTFQTPETAFERFCGDCNAVWDERPLELIEADQ